MKLLLERSRNQEPESLILILQVVALYVGCQRYPLRDSIRPLNDSKLDLISLTSISELIPTPNIRYRFKQYIEPVRLVIIL